MANAMVNGNWIRDLMPGITMQLFAKYVLLWSLIDATTFDPSANEEDKIFWIRTPNAEYTASSTYNMQFDGGTKSPFLAKIWCSSPRNGCPVNFPSNPHFRLVVASKTAPTSSAMEAREDLFTHHGVVVREVGPLALRSYEDLKDIILHQFGFRKHEFHVHHSYPASFIMIFLEGMLDMGCSLLVVS
jgi:hypothetical protein